MNELHKYGLIRFSKKTGKIDTTMTALGKGLIQLWALQNTSKTKACVVLDLTDRKVFTEYIGTDRFPIVRKSEADYEFDVPDELFDFLSAEESERK